MQKETSGQVISDQPGQMVVGAQQAGGSVKTEMCIHSHPGRSADEVLRLQAVVRPRPLA